MRVWRRGRPVKAAPSKICAAGLPARLRREASAFVLAARGRLSPYRTAERPLTSQVEIALRLRGLLLRQGAGRALPRHTACLSCARFFRCPPVFSDGKADGHPAPKPPAARYRVQLGPAGTEGAAQKLFQWLDLCAKASRRAQGLVSGRAAHVRMSQDGRTARLAAGTAEPHEVMDLAVGKALRVRAADLPGRSRRPDWSLTLEPEPRGWSHRRGKMASIFILRRCTAHCVMCHVQDVYRGEDMPLWRIFSLVEELRTLGYDRIEYFGGEPTLRADLPKALAAASWMDCRTSIITNGMLVTDSLAQRLRRSRLSLAIVSLDAPRAEIHDRIRGVKGGFRQAVAGIRALAAAARLDAEDPERRRMEVNLDTVILPENLDALEEHIAKAAELGATHVNFFLCVTAPLLAHRPMWLDRERARRLFTRILPRCRLAAKRLGITFTVSPDVRSQDAGTIARFIGRISRGIYNPHYPAGPVCAAPRDELYINLHGEVFPCTSPTILETGHRMGNAFRRTVCEILLERPLTGFAKAAGRHEACRMCWRAHTEPRMEGRYMGSRVI